MERDKITSDRLSFCFTKRRSSPSSSSDLPSSEALLLEKDGETKPGWKAMPYILGNESIERMATYGMTTNFMVYLLREYHMDQVPAANILMIWSCAFCLLTVVGAIVADIYLGKFLTISLASFSTLLGMVTVTLTSFVPQLRPPPCIDDQQCDSTSIFQLGFLLMGLFWLAIGTGGIRPCCISFGVDQFDSTTTAGRQATTSYLNWYYLSFTVIMLINQTFVVYIQDAVSWTLGFGIPTILMLGAIVLFFFGSKIYYYVQPGGSSFSSFAQVLVAAYKKRHLKLHNDDRVQGVFFDDSSNGNGNVVLSKFPLSQEFSFLKKAALMMDNELEDDGSSANPWSLCTVQQVEEVICASKVIPIWASAAIAFLPYAQEGTFFVSQAMKMDRHIGPNFEIPAGSIKMMSLITMVICLPLYDRVLVPVLRKITKHENGIPILQRTGIGYIFSIVTMVFAGLIEQQRRVSVEPMSVFWLYPQNLMLGLTEVFAVLGLIEFFNKEFPESMNSVGNSLLYLCMFGATYSNGMVVNIVDRVTGKDGQPSWLDNDINAGRLDYFYFLIAGLEVLNFVYFLSCARGYIYKASAKVVGTGPLV